jgi:MFS family permease
MWTAASPDSVRAVRSAYLSCAVIGLGGLFAGVTGPLLSTFVPPLVRDALGEHRTAIGLVMAIDNVLLLLLLPIAGAASDRAGRYGAVSVVSAFRHRRSDWSDCRALHRHQHSAVAVPGADC